MVCRKEEYVLMDYFNNITEMCNKIRDFIDKTYFTEKQWNFVGKSFSEDTEENDNFFRVSNLDKEYFKQHGYIVSFITNNNVTMVYNYGHIEFLQTEALRIITENEAQILVAYAIFETEKLVEKSKEDNTDFWCNWIDSGIGGFGALEIPEFREWLNKNIFEKGN